MDKERISVAKYIAQQLSMCGKTQAVVSSEIGYENPNVLTMFKQGKTKLPINKISSLAKALGVDAQYLLKLTLMQYQPETWDVISEILGKQIVTENEYKILEVIEGAANGKSVKPETEKEKKELVALVNKWIKREEASYESFVNTKVIK